jgi:hypothetical protein
MATASFGWMFAALSLMALLVNLGFLVFLLTRYGKYPKPTLLALLAFGIMLLSTIMHWGVNFALTRFLDSETAMLATLASSFFSTLGHFGSLFLLVAAIYTDRKQGVASNSDDFVGRSTISSENPYSPPENR